MSLESLQERIRAAAAARTPLELRGGGSKAFYGNAPRGEVLDTRACAGIVAYEPSELVVTARGGTPLAELEQVLDAAGQCLPFEPPHFGAATFGGAIAAGLAGPRRASAGAVRDFVLGVKLIDGRGRLLAFGGRVMKNVAGYDVSRVVAGSLGVLGLVAEASVKVLPKPRREATLRLEADERTAIERLNAWAGKPLPVSATAWHEGVLRIRLSGSEAAVHAARETIGGEAEEGETFWRAVREQTHPFFAGEAPLWRLALPSTCPPLGLGATFIEWGGAQRWLRASAAPSEIRAAAVRAGGHATRFRGGERSAGTFTPLDETQARLHRALKQAFDPEGILNPGRLYAEL